MNEVQKWLGTNFTCDCGGTHSIPVKHISIEKGAIQAVAPYLQQAGYDRALLVGDSNTWEAAGILLEESFLRQGAHMDKCVLQPNAQGEIAADEQAIVEVMLKLKEEHTAIVAVGSGTIHDLVRFVCHRSGRAFISVPTAPSVDGFVSVGAPLIVRGFKQTIPAFAPEAVFADVSVLAKAPQRMIAAGFGDMLGKYTSLSDWELGRILFKEAYCEKAVGLTRQAIKLCLDNVDDIAQGTETGVTKLMEALILSGYSMLFVGNSRPASGGEHHLSHFWEMTYIKERKPALLHGAKVGVATVLMAERYRKLAAMSKEEALTSLSTKPEPTQAMDEQLIREAYGDIAEQVIEENFPGGKPSAESGADMGKLLAQHWEEISQVARQVPAPEQLAAWLKQSGGPATADELGVNPNLVRLSLSTAMFVRSRYSILRLSRLL
jgi:glycerol-1-phosphate dehydrogenase [NAD(P)+]